MLTARNYIIAAAFGLVAGFIGFMLLQGENRETWSALLQGAVIGLVGAGGYLYGQYNRSRHSQKQSKAKMSKKQMKRAQKRK